MMISFTIKKEIRYIKEFEDDDEIIKASENPDGTISFQLKFYNGGASMNECLEEAIDKL